MVNLRRSRAADAACRQFFMRAEQQFAAISRRVMSTTLPRSEITTRQPPRPLYRVLAFSFEKEHMLPSRGMPISLLPPPLSILLSLAPPASSLSF